MTHPVICDVRNPGKMNHPKHLVKHYVEEGVSSSKDLMYDATTIKGTLRAATSNSYWPEAEVSMSSYQQNKPLLPDKPLLAFATHFQLNMRMTPAPAPPC